MKIQSKAMLIFVAFVLATQGTSSTLANATDRDNDDRPTIRLVEQIHDFALLDEGTPGPGLGDRLVFTSDLFDTDSNLVGRDSADCVTVRDPGAQQIVQCIITVQLPNGEITLQGMAQGTDNVFAITGGTGEYLNARGQARATDRVPLQTADITIKLNQ